MFIFGTNDFDDSSCDSKGCHCYCETTAMSQGICNTITNTGYRLYKYTSGDYDILYNENLYIKH